MAMGRGHLQKPSSDLREPAPLKKADTTAIGEMFGFVPYQTVGGCPRGL
jgi:hypothetical protein